MENSRLDGSRRLCYLLSAICYSDELQASPAPRRPPLIQLAVTESAIPEGVELQSQIQNALVPFPITERCELASFFRLRLTEANVGADLPRWSLLSTGL